MLGINIDKHCVATVFLRHQTIFGHLATYAIRIGGFLIDLRNSNDNRNIRSLRVVNSFHRLRHNTVIGSDHNNSQVCRFSTTCTHSGKCFVTWGINKSDNASASIHRQTYLVSTDMLGNSTRFVLTYISTTNGIQQTGLAVVNMAHDGDNRWTTL